MGYNKRESELSNLELRMAGNRSIRASYMSWNLRTTSAKSKMLEILASIDNSYTRMVRDHERLIKSEV